MRRQADTTSVGTTRWGQRHPRLVAAGAGLIAASVVALTMAAAASGGQYDALGLLLQLESTFVPVAAIWAFILFGPYTRQAGRGPWLAMLSGVACAMLTIATLAAYDALSTCWRYSFCTNFFEHTWSMISIAMIISTFMAFAPQLMGALGGGAIWLLTRDR